MKIPAILTHPEIMGPPLERGTRYGHHFVVELISDGKRLWAAASEEGKKVIHEIEHGLTGEEEPEKVGPTVAEWVAAGYKAAAYPPRGYESRSTPEEIAAAIAAETTTGSEAVGKQSPTGTEAVTDPANPGNGNPNVGAQSLDPDGKPATGGTPEPMGAAPTTTVGPANTFDS